MSEVAAYRLVATRWAGSAFDGEGARRFGGRWNGRGRAAVYVADSEALSLLEVLVNLRDPAQLNHRRLFRLMLPAELIQPLNATALPDDWREDPPPASTARIGDEWLGGAGALALAVPSTVAVRDSNYLLNPAHPAFAGVVGKAEELALTVDARLVARRAR